MPRHRRLSVGSQQAMDARARVGDNRFHHLSPFSRGRRRPGYPEYQVAPNRLGRVFGKKSKVYGNDRKLISVGGEKV